MLNPLRTLSLPRRRAHFIVVVDQTPWILLSTLSPRICGFLIPWCHFMFKAIWIYKWHLDWTDNSSAAPYCRIASISLASNLSGEIIEKHVTGHFPFSYTFFLLNPHISPFSLKFGTLIGMCLSVDHFLFF